MNANPRIESITLFGVPFYRYGTGGGCEALRADLPDGSYLLLTDNDAFLPRANDWILARYESDESGELLQIIGINESGAHYL